MSDSRKQFHELLKERMDEFVHLTYRITKDFPKEELYSATSQLRRAALSVILNYVEGFARKRRLVKINFFEISYGSLQESKYLFEFAQKENWVTEAIFRDVAKMANEIGAMLWKTIENLENS